MSGAVWIGLCILLGALALEIFAPIRMTEGFQALTGSGSSGSGSAISIPNILTNMINRRGDVGLLCVLLIECAFRDSTRPRNVVGTCLCVSELIESVERMLECRGAIERSWSRWQR